MLATNLIEHRTEPREDTNRLVKFRSINGSHPNEDFAVILDITELGASLFTYTPVAIGTRIFIHTGENTKLLAEVVSSTSDKSSDMARMGVRFIKEEMSH
jgi:hypothetical protein